jgi:hypothetical protein
MIIKSLSRKDGSYSSFKQLYDYITRDNGCDPKYNFTQNFIFDNRAAVLKEFTRNAEYLKKRKNGNYLYHEIISLTRTKDLSEAQQKEALRRVSIQYIQERSNGCLAFGGLHHDKDNQLHMHLIVSANQLEQTKRHVLSRKQFDTAKRNAETFVLERHPELKQEKLITKPRTYKDDKEKLTDAIQKQFDQAKTIEAFYENLKAEGYSHKVRGKTHTFIIDKTGKRHRLKKLGLESDYINFLINAGVEPGKVQSEAQPNYKAGKDKVDTIVSTSKEWVAGDFDKRDKRTTKKKYEKQNKADTATKERSDQTRFENTTETLNEWFTGDHSKRDARSRNEKSKKRFEENNRKQPEKAKDKDAMSFTERAKETSKEWLAGDFSSREALDRDQQSKDRLNTFIKDKDKATGVKGKEDMKLGERVKETTKEWVAGDFSSRNTRADQRIQKDKIDALKKARSKAAERDKGKDKGKTR